MTGDIPLPSALDAEGSVLCAIFDDSAGLALDQVRSILLGPEDFYSKANQLIYETICMLADEGQSPSPVSVAQRLNDNNKLKEVGGTKYIYETIALTTPAVVYVEQHALVVREKSRLRQMINTCKALAAQAYGESGESVQGFIEGAELSIGSIAHSSGAANLKPLKSILENVQKATYAARERKSDIVGHITGFTALDELTSGVHDGDLRVIAGRPGMGKTAYALVEAMGIARHGFATAFFSLEMPELQLGYRLVAIESGIVINKLRSGTLKDDEWAPFTDAIARLSKLPMWIDDTPALTPGQLRSRTRRLMLEIEKGQHPHVTENAVGGVYADYLQLMHSPVAGQRGVNREVEVSTITRTLKEIAKVLKVPITALSQLNRGVESRADKHPLLSDLRECLIGDTVIWSPDGDRTIRELVQANAASRVYAHASAGVNRSTERNHFVETDATPFWSTGIKPVFEVRTEGGRSIIGTANHPLLAMNWSWRAIEDLCKGELIAVADSRTNLRVAFERITAIIPAGEEETFDTTVPRWHTFVANGFITHNSGAIEQDADTVIFLYRPEYYFGSETPPDDRGICECIVAKQRNGATATVRLRFTAETTRFDNLSRPYDEFDSQFDSYMGNR